MQQNPKLAAILKEAMEGDERSCSLYAEFKELAKDDNLWMEREIDIRKIIPHIDNREGAMGNGGEAMQVWNYIDNSGVIPELWDDATAFEVCGKSDPSYQRWFEKVSHDNELPHYDPETNYIGATTACTHLCIALNASLQNMAHPNPNLTHNGQLSIEAIKKRHPLMASRNPWEKLKFTFWKKEAEQLYPQLPALACRALNLKYITQQGVDSFQQFSMAASLFQQAYVNEKADPPEFVASKIRKSSKLDHDSSMAIAEVARKYGGIGTRSLVDFVNVHKVKNQERGVAGSTWAAMKKLASAQDDQTLTPYMIHSILMALASAPNASAIISSDITRCVSGKNAQDLQKAETMIKRMLELSSAMGLTKNQEVYPIGCFRVAMAMKVFGNKLTANAKKGLEEICIDAFDSLLKIAPRESQVPCPWTKPTSTTEPPKSNNNVDTRNVNRDRRSDAPRKTSIQYDSNGNAVGLDRVKALQAGWKPGVYLKSKSDGLYI